MRTLRITTLGLSVVVLGALSVFGVTAPTPTPRASIPDSVPAAAPHAGPDFRRYGDLPPYSMCTPADVFFSADGTQVAGCFHCGRVGWAMCWDVRSGKQMAELTEAERQTFTGAFLPNGRLLTASLDDTLLTWDVESGKALSLRGPEQPRRPSALLWTCNVKLSPDGRTVACPILSPTADPHVKGIQLVEVASGRCRGELTGTDSKWAAAFAFSPDGRSLLGAVAEGCVIWDLETGKIVHRLESTAGARAGCFSPDGRRVALTGAFTEPAPPDERTWQRLKLIDLDTGKVWHCTYDDYYRNEGEKAVVWSADGRLLATISMRTPRVHLWDATTGDELCTIDYPSSGTFTGGVAFSPDSKSLAVTTSFGNVLLYDLTTRPFWKESPRKRTMLTASEDESLTQAERDRLWDDLGATDAATAYRATLVLGRRRADAVALLRDRLRPVKELSPEQVARLIAALDDNSYATRQRASGELRIVGRQIASELRTARQATLSPEVRRRLGAILDELGGELVTDAETLRSLHAIEVLERVGGLDAVGVLRALAQGAVGAEQSQEAKMVLRRLTAD